MIIDTEQLREKMEDEKQSIENFTIESLIEGENKFILDLWRLERIEELHKKYFMGKENEAIAKNKNPV